MDDKALKEWKERKSHATFPSRDADDFYDGDAWKRREGFDAGLSAGEQVGKIIGALEAIGTCAMLHTASMHGFVDEYRDEMEKMREEAEAKLAELLGKEGA